MALSCQKWRWLLGADTRCPDAALSLGAERQRHIGVCRGCSAPAPHAAELAARLSRLIDRSLCSYQPPTADKQIKEISMAGDLPTSPEHRPSPQLDPTATGLP